MSKFYTLIFTIFFILITKLSLAENVKYLSCGIDKYCESGYYCSGADGDSNSGVCVANALNITLCRFIKYIQNDIFQYIAIFSAVFLGIYMFVGKVSSTTIAQTILGIGILYGSQQLVIKITGSTKGACTAKEANSCLSDVTEVGDSSHGNIIYTNIRNTSIVNDYKGDRCELLECVSAMCEHYRETIENNVGTCVTTSGPRIQKIIPLNRTIIDDSPEISISPTAKCPNFKIKCKPIKVKSEKRYLLCKNNCTNETYAAKVESSLGLTTCKDLSLKNIGKQ